MNKRLYLIVISLLGFSLLSCGSESDQAQVYKLEQLHTQAMEKEQQVLGIKPELATPESVESVIAEFRNVIDYYNENFGAIASRDSLTQDDRVAAGLAGQSLLEIGQLHLMVGDTGAAIEALSSFEDNFPKNYLQLKLAWLGLAELQIKKQNIPAVEDLYLKLIKKFDPPVNTQGQPSSEILKLPFELVQYFSSLENEAKVDKYAQIAEDYYGKLISEYPETSMAMVATRHLANVYRITERPQSAIDLLLNVKDSTGKIRQPAVIMIADTYFQDVGNPQKAIEYYNQALDYPIDSTFTPMTLMKLGEAYLLEKQFDKARETLRMLIEKHEYARQSHAQAYRFIAISYEDEKEYQQALDNYTAIIERYPETPLAFETYVYLPKFFDKQNKKQLRDQWYNKAEEFFKNMRDTYKKDDLGAAAQEYLARLYLSDENWKQAIGAIQELARDFQGYRVAGDAYLRIGAIYENELNMPDSARYYYQQQIDMFPEQKASRIAQEKIEQLL